MDYSRVRRRKRRRRRRILQFFGIVILLALIVVLSCLLIYKLKDYEKEPEYKFYSLNDEVTARAYVWLSKIDDMPLSYEEVKSMMGDIKLKVILTPVKEKGKISLGKKKYTQKLADGAYDNCKNQAKAGLERAYREVLRYRMQNAGYEGEISDDMLNDLMKEAYGMSISAYISYCEAPLLPDLDEVSRIYSGETTIE